jgi:casein kinase II subunit alpha
VCSFIGSGGFSAVFLGQGPSGQVAIKTYRPVSIDFLKRELFFLRAIASCPNVIHYIDLVRDPESSAISLITEYVPSSNPRSFYQTLTLRDVRHYMRLLFATLDSVHSRGVMHRDVKPQNILIDSERRTLRLIDWGLAELYYPGQQYASGVGTARYRAPELMLDYRHYDYAVDIWSAGVTLGEMIVKYPLFDADAASDILREVSELISSSAFLEFAEKCGIEVGDYFLDSLSTHPFDGWSTLKTKLKPGMKDDAAFDLLRKLLSADPGERPSAREALDHPFFADEPT